MATVRAHDEQYVYADPGNPNNMYFYGEPGDTLLIVLAAPEHLLFSLPEGWVNAIDPDDNDASMPLLGQLLRPYRFVGETLPEVVPITPNSMGSYYSAMLLTLTLEEGEDIGTWHIGGDTNIELGDMLSLDGAPEADGQVVIGGFVSVSSPC